MTAKNKKLFLVSPYHPDSNGQLIPEWPDNGPCHLMNKDSCKLSLNHCRERKTGPCIPLYVVCCTTHEKAFTIYPPGHVPYGRKGILKAAPDGSAIRDSIGIQRFTETLFDAALDAAEDTIWPKESLVDSLTSRYLTQRRHIDRAAMLLGIAPSVDNKLQEKAAEALDVPCLLLRDNAQLYKAQNDSKSRGTAICCILESMPESAIIFERLARAGAIANLWPQSQLWYRPEGDKSG